MSLFLRSICSEKKIIEKLYIRRFYTSRKIADVLLLYNYESRYAINNVAQSDITRIVHELYSSVSLITK